MKKIILTLSILLISQSSAFAFEPYIGEIMLSGFNFCPRGYAKADGQLLPINQNQSLFSILGTTYGGDGRTDFALPDLRGRVPMHPTNSNSTRPNLGQKGGLENVTLTINEIPQHSHSFSLKQGGPKSKEVFANPGDFMIANAPIFRFGGTDALGSSSIESTGGSQAHNNMQPYTTINYCIALTGLFPPRN